MGTGWVSGVGPPPIRKSAPHEVGGLACLTRWPPWPVVATASNDVTRQTKRIESTTNGTNRINDKQARQATRVDKG